jgi:hypothetical protein
MKPLELLDLLDRCSQTLVGAGLLTEEQADPFFIILREAKLELTAGPTHFEEFWLCYPRKVGKPAALNAFKRLNCDKHFEAIKANLLARLASKEWEVTPTRLPFVPHPTTYLNQARWLDAPLPRAHTRWDQV